MDIATIGGLILGFVLIVWGILQGSNIGAFIDVGSVIIVIGGAFAALFVSYPLPQVLTFGSVGSKSFQNAPFEVGKIIEKVIELANVARREGLLALEEAVSEIKDDFLQKGVMLIVDGTDPELVKNILETEVANIEDRHGTNKGMFENMGSLFPAFGMVGTLIGLVAMLQNLSDPSAIGPAMAVALLTTFYGSLFANLIFNPIATKLDYKSKNEMLVKQVMIEGLLSIQAGENPRIIEEKLKAFLPPKMRKSIGTQEAEENNG
ncbi:motility protein A [Helicovermis profundi]|uniref:Motility protein A n=1 Tax=Helicovermis profundi TaxID=3065157 RepID=A0AAU9E406_9FIRM|nr:motility protein A [Clostridia bacterium S502]